MAPLSAAGVKELAAGQPGRMAESDPVTPVEPVT
jgi:hypothetical protein